MSDCPNCAALRAAKLQFKRDNAHLNDQNVRLRQELAAVRADLDADREEWQRQLVEFKDWRRVAEELAEALTLARQFLGLAIRGSTNNAATTADAALARYREAVRK